MRRQVTPSVAVASIRGIFVFLFLFHHIHIIHSAGRTDFLTGHLYIHLGLSAILGTEVPPVRWTHHPMFSLSSTSTVGTKCESDFVRVGQICRGMSAIVNYYECAGTQRLSNALEPLSLSTFLKRTTKLHCKANSTYMTSSSLSCRNRTIKDD